LLFEQPEQLDIVIAMGHRLGLSSEDARDAAQETLTRFFTLYRAGRYDRSRGRLGSWLVGIARNCIAAHRERAFGVPRGDRISEAAPAALDDRRLSVVWAEERDRAILRESLRRLRAETAIDERTLVAFDLFAMRGEPAAAVAEQLGMAPNDVYVAKHRCLRRLRGIVAELSTAYDDMEVT